MDLLFQVMLQCGCLLSEKITVSRIGGKEVFSVADGYLIACFDKDVSEDVIAEIAKQQPVYFVMRDASAASDNVMDNFDQLFRHYSPDTLRRIL
jgi:adenine-specific DNA-methyltransferase